MKLTMDVASPAAYFFNKIINSSLYDIKAQTGEDLTIEEMKDFTFKKKASNGHDSILTITDVILNQKYAYSLRTGRNTYKVSYNIVPTGDDSMTLNYEESSEGINSQIDANNRVTGFLLGWFRKRNFKKMTKEIETSYQTFKKAV